MLSSYKFKHQFFGILFYIKNITAILSNNNFTGWGRKRTGRFAVWCHKKFGGSLKLLEDGFIRSLGLGVDGSPSFSLVEDDVGIYYDATAPSRLENILNEYDFASDTKLMDDAKRAIAFILEYNISKYNNAPEVAHEILNQVQDDKSSKILIIAQTAGDASLKYGMLDNYTTGDMINVALSENPDAHVYLKVHPDVLSGNKKSDIDIATLDVRVQIITENINPISLLKHFDKVYTKTSGMGFEALLVGCECICFGMPFYAGWGITTDKSTCSRRKRVLSVEKVFAAAYILYTRYTNPYTKKECDIFEAMESIVRMRENYDYGEIEDKRWGQTLFRE